MPYALDKDGNHYTDEDGNKIMFTVEYLDTDDWYKHREPIHLYNDNEFEIVILLSKKALLTTMLFAKNN